MQHVDGSDRIDAGKVVKCGESISKFGNYVTYELTKCLSFLLQRCNSVYATGIYITIDVIVRYDVDLGEFLNCLKTSRGKRTNRFIRCKFGGWH